MSIGSRLREAREALGFTQHVLAAELKATERTVNNWERDFSSPTAVALAAMAALGLDVRYVITGKRDYAAPEPLTLEEQGLLAHWRAAPREARGAALGALLGASLRPAQVEQVFHGHVGQVVHGTAKLGAVVAHEAPGPYPPARKPAKKP